MISDRDEGRPDLILASGSPRRRELLAGLGIEFVVRPVDIDETPLAGESPMDLVERLSLAKAREQSTAGEIVLAADTIVVLDDRILGKPRDRADATTMLSQLRGREHTVLTGVAVLDGASGGEHHAVARTQVRIAALDDALIAWYVDTGEPMDKAGSYAIQGIGAAFVEAIRGNYTNVVGLPLPMVRNLLAELGHDLLDFRGQ